jgi:hypothetical protein
MSTLCGIRYVELLMITLGFNLQARKGVVVSMWLYPVMSAAIRMSTLLFYQRIFGASDPRFKTVIRVLLALQGVYIIVFSILPAPVCKPFYYAWVPLEHRFHCDDTYYYRTQVGLYSVSMAFDTILLVLPILPVMHLQMSMRKRIGVAAIFALGAGWVSSHRGANHTKLTI